MRERKGREGAGERERVESYQYIIVCNIETGQCLSEYCLYTSFM